MTLHLINFIDILITEGYTVLRITEDEVSQEQKTKYSWWICNEFTTVGKIENEDFNFNSVRGVEITNFLERLNLNYTRIEMLKTFQSYLEKFENETISMDFSPNMKWKKYRK